MKTYFAMVCFTVAATCQEPVKHQPISKAWDVPAVKYTTPPSYPCNLSPSGKNGTALAVCITGDETHWKCADSARVLLQSEDGVKHCILFPPQESEVVEIKGKQ